MPPLCDQGSAGPSPGGELGRDTPRPTAAAGEPSGRGPGRQKPLGNRLPVVGRRCGPRVRRSCALHSSRLPPYAPRGTVGPDGDVRTTAIHRFPGSQPMSRSHTVEARPEPYRRRHGSSLRPPHRDRSGIFPRPCCRGGPREDVARGPRILAPTAVAQGERRPSGRSSRAGTPVRPASHQKRAVPPCFGSCDAGDES